MVVEKQFICFFQIIHNNRNIQDDIKKENYISRHRPNENWDKINPASSSRYILWSKKTLKKSLKSFMKRFNIKDSRNTN